MGTPKLSTFIVALIWISFISIGLITYLAAFTSNYNVEVDNSSIAVYDKLDELNTQVDDIQNSTNIQESSDKTDIIGGYISAGYQALKTAMGSFDVFSALVNSVTDTQLGVSISNLGPLKSAIIASVLVLLVIGVLLAAIMKWRL